MTEVDTVKKVLVAALAFVAFSAVQASAVTIDFTNNVWNPGFPADDKTVGSTTVESIPQIPIGALSWSNSDGFGVISLVDLDPTIGTFEGIKVTFSQPFTLTSFLLGNLNVINAGFFTIPEVGYYSLNGGAWQAVNGTASGNVTVNLAPTLVTSLVFGYDGISLWDFSVKSVTGDFQTTQPPSVPEPTSMVLLGSGLAALAARARRKKA
jgi:hypothetical protein